MATANYVTQNQLDTALKAQTEEIVGVLHAFMQQVDERFTKLELLSNGHDTNFDRLIGTIDSFIGRLDRSETEVSSRDVQFERLLEWAREVSVKTGIPLKNL